MNRKGQSASSRKRQHMLYIDALKRQHATRVKREHAIGHNPPEPGCAMN